MRFGQLAKLFYDWGWSISHEDYVSFSDYVKEMIKRKRVVLIQDGDTIEGVLFFFLTNDHNSIYKKRFWDCPKDEDAAKEIFIDKLVCRKFTTSLRKKIQQVFEEIYPEAERAFYHRAPFDRCVEIKLGVKHELQNTVLR